MGGMSGFNVLYPYAWFASAGDATGDLPHNHAYAPDGNFFNDQGHASGAAHPATVADLTPGATGAAYPIGTYAGYVNASLQNPGNQLPLPGGPAMLKGPQQGPWTQSDYTAALPSQYVSAAPPWKNAPMQHAANSLPSGAQAAIHSTGSSPSARSQGGGGCAGCGGCGSKGGNSKTFCKGQPHQALQLDSTNDFPPLYSQPTATANQVVNAALYHATSTHTPAWTVAQGAPSDSEIPLQGH